MGAGFLFFILSIQLWHPQGDCRDKLAASTWDVRNYREEEILQLLDQSEKKEDWLIAFRELVKEWNLHSIFKKLEKNPDIKLTKLDPAFRIPIAVLDEIVESFSIILKTQPPEIQTRYRQALRDLRGTSTRVFPTRDFLENTDYSDFLGLWYELRAASHFAARGYDIILFRERFKMRDLDNPRYRANGEIDLLVENGRGELILVEVKKGIHQYRNHKDQFGRFQRILAGRTSFPFRVQQVQIFIPEGFSESENNLLAKYWPKFKAGSLDPDNRQEQRFFHIEFPSRDSVSRK